MDRRIIYDQSDVRSYDHLWNARSGVFALGQLALDLLGTTSTLVSGFAATPTGPASLSINLAAGDVYYFADVDATAYGDLTSDTTETDQQGFAAAQTLTLSTSGLTSGQSRWALVQATFTQVDDIPSDDPTGGLLPYINTSDPFGPPWSGPDNDGLAQNTRRRTVATVSVIYGTAASTGTEVPPNPSANNVPMYLIDLAYGQTAITSGEILIAGPSVGVNVPSNYVQAPFLAGLLNSHHSGGAGQAPKVNLATEVQGILPVANMPVVRFPLTTNMIFYVSSTGSNSTGTGTSGNPWATPNYAANYIHKYIDLSNVQATIQIQDTGSPTTYSVAVSVSGPFVGANSPVILQGNVTTPGRVILGDGVIVDGAASLQLQYLDVTCTTRENVLAQNAGRCIIGTGVRFGLCGEADMHANTAGQIIIQGNYSIIGNSTYHYLADPNSSIIGNSLTCTVGAGLSITVFAQASYGGHLDLQTMTYAGSTPTGTRYDAQYGGSINTGGGGASYFPGTIGGSATTGYYV